MISDLKIYWNFIQSSESPFVRDLVWCHIGVSISNPKNTLNNAIIEAKDTGLLRLEITFYRHTRNEPLTRNFILKYMNYLKEKHPDESIYYNSINNQSNLVCNNTVFKKCICNTKLDVAPISLIQILLTGNQMDSF